MLEWLREKHQTERGHPAFLASGAGQRGQRRSGPHGGQPRISGFLAWVFWPARIPTKWACRRCRLGDLYAPEAWKRIGNVRLHLRDAGGARDRRERRGSRREVAAGEQHTADYYVSALPFERLPAVVPDLDSILDGFEHSPITGIHLWFDRRVTDLPHATLLDRTIQWMFNKSGGRYVQLVVSASRSLVEIAARGSDRAGACGSWRNFSPRRAKRSWKRRTW